MELVTPGLGLIFWMTISFFIAVLILRSVAWKPLLKDVKEREKNIEESLLAAEKAKEEMNLLTVNNEKILREAREERDAMLAEAKKMKENILNEAREKAKIEYEKILESAKEALKTEKQAAITEMKNQIAAFSVEIAEKILKEELDKSEKQSQFINKLIDEIHFN